MSEPRDSSNVRITFTPEQAAQVKSAVGRDADGIELSLQELEQRIVPNLIASPSSVASPDALAANSSETILVP